MPKQAEQRVRRRLALVVAASSYSDPTLAQLRAPGRDAARLAEVLGDSRIGQFVATTVLDARGEQVRRTVAEFCSGAHPEDLVLMYLSCHGLLDDRGRLYYATMDTEQQLLSVTAIPAQWLNEQLEDCRAKRQILILDCCHSGAFAKGAKGEHALALKERFEGRGRVVLTASRGTEYSFERGQPVGDDTRSVFTDAIVRGLASGEADRDHDGEVTVEELYSYAFDQVRATESHQTPSLWTYGAEGSLLVAHSPRGAIIEASPLPEDLEIALVSRHPDVRRGAVAALANLLTGPQAGLALTSILGQEDLLRF